MKVKIILDWFFWILLSLLIFVAGNTIAFLTPLSLLAAPAPLMILACRRGVRESLAVSVLGTLCAHILMGPVMAFIYFCEFAALGVLMGSLLKRSKSGADYILSAIAASAAVKVLLMAVLNYAAGVNAFVITPESAEAFVSSLSGVLSQGGVSVSDETLKEYAAMMAQTAALLMPSMIILFSSLDAIVSYAVIRMYFKKTKEMEVPPLPSFSRWRFPKNIFWALLAALILDMASKAFPDEFIFRVLSLNLMEVLRGVFLIEGLSLVWYFMTAYKVNTVAKACIVAVGAVFAPVSYILSMVGIFDIWYDLRKRIKLRGK